MNTKYKCASCKTSILIESSSVNCCHAEGKFYHPECLRCTLCSSQIGRSGYYNVDHKLQCRKCYEVDNIHQCVKCTEKITENYLETDGPEYWHKKCLVCYRCKKVFTDFKFYTIDGLPYCLEHSRHLELQDYMEEMAELQGRECRPKKGKK